MNQQVYQQLVRQFREHFGVAPSVAAYAPGRVEILGNHTDYNEGLVLSAAINCGTFFVATPARDGVCRLVAGDVNEECRFALSAVAPAKTMAWANYVKGVWAGLTARHPLAHGFWGMFRGDVPLGAGLSSSAALEMSAGLALCAVYGIKLDPLDLAKIGQAAEHRYAGVKCGLLDQMTSLFGREDALVLSDFRALSVETVPLGAEACFLICNTAVKHALVESEYNERRERCEEAARFFAQALAHPVRALRDVSWEEWARLAPRMDPVVARRAAHIVGENTRVAEGRQLLAAHKLAAFGALMFVSHESSRTQFENSCAELDRLVACARETEGVLGARLSGGGFGGSAVMLVRVQDAPAVAERIAACYGEAFGHPCTTMIVRPAAGGMVLDV